VKTATKPGTAKIVGWVQKKNTKQNKTTQNKLKKTSHKTPLEYDENKLKHINSPAFGSI